MTDKPVVLITGAAGDVGTALAETLSKDYEPVGIDLDCAGAAYACFECDITDEKSLKSALKKVEERFGTKLAGVIHLAAYFDFTNEDSPAYRAVNIEGTSNLLKGLSAFDVAQFIYSGTMLVHAPAVPGGFIDEETPLEPKWAYPQWKAKTEALIEKERGDMPVLFLHLAGMYDDESAVPTLSQQIARIYERGIKSHLYAGDPNAGQAMVHKADLAEAFRCALDKRGNFAEVETILIGEPHPLSYQTLQNELGYLIHGEEEWPTYTLPKTAAKAGAWAEEKFEPAIPDAIDRGEKPFIRPFMVDMGADHYALDISKAERLLGWHPRRFIRDYLPSIVDALKKDPLGWYEKNGITPPEWLRLAGGKPDAPEIARVHHDEKFKRQHRAFLWAPFCNLALASWLVTLPPLLGTVSGWITLSDVVSGALLAVFALLSLSWRMSWARWVCGAIGVWVMSAPLIFWAPTAAAYLNGTLVGALIFACALLVRPVPHLSVLAAEAGQVRPPGWSLNPSSWLQRLPIIILAFIGLYISRYLAAYQLGHIDGVWEPFFAGSLAAKNGTEQIITSSVSKAWPVPDAGLGALTYLLEILTGIMGSQRRWRTMPWLVIIFGIMIVPLGTVSITFIIIQPIVIGTWCTLCLIAAAAMILQIPYSLDELVATFQFLGRRRKAGESVLRVFCFGSRDDPALVKEEDCVEEDPFQNAPGTILKETWTGGVRPSLGLALCCGVGVWLMFTPLTLASSGIMADANHLIGALTVTISVAAFAEVARLLRFFNVLFGGALIIVPFVAEADAVNMGAAVLSGFVLIAASLRRGPVTNRYGAWQSRIL
ncbi:vitamin K epoxide reductase family protein [Tepidicaulis sp.]|uniref:vitamin K epoxide reductase family protein n=1 Tax=Tepidicaulis sp. TaxID=1920809 RepID=UPI003B5B622B